MAKTKTASTTKKKKEEQAKESKTTAEVRKVLLYNTRELDRLLTIELEDRELLEAG
jgi:hypothetical protein